MFHIRIGAVTHDLYAQADRSVMKTLPSQNRMRQPTPVVTDVDSNGEWDDEEEEELQKTSIKDQKEVGKPAGIGVI